MVLGALACELFDVDQMHERYRLAIQANPGNISALSNYSVSLSRIGLLREAVNVLHKLVEREPTNLAHLRNLVKEQFHGFMLSDAMESLKVLQKRDPNHDAGRHANIHKAAALLDSLGHAKDYGERQMGIACALLREKKLRCREFSLFVNDEFDDSTVFVQLRLFVRIEAAIGLSEELFGRLDQAIEDWNPAHLSISFEAGAPDYER